jgi:hypothetical protein
MQILVYISTESLETGILVVFPALLIDTILPSAMYLNIVNFAWIVLIWY